MANILCLYQKRASIITFHAILKQQICQIIVRFAFADRNKLHLSTAVRHAWLKTVNFFTFCQKNGCLAV
jgi:hypothetical protein